MSAPVVSLPVVELIGVPVDLGAGRRGVRFGPDAVRAADLREKLESLRYQVRDAGNVVVPEGGEEPREPHRPRHLRVVRAACVAVADAVERSLRAGAFPVVVGGDHSMAIGVLAGAARALGPQGVVWIDAHADMNTPDTSPSGNIHGMSMAAALGDMPELFGPPEFPVPSADATRCVFVGLRELDAAERERLKERGLTCFTMADIDRHGMATVMERAIAIAGRGPRSAHVSLDIDTLDPSLAPGTGTPVPGGLTYREAHLAMELIAEARIAHSLEIAEVNPTLDDGTMTARVAMELICSALGKTIL